jgi:uncharacterized membrane protein YfcA
VLTDVLLALAGLGVGILGTLIGAGGGFLLVPALALVYPDKSPALLAAVSLAVIFCNAVSGSVGYARQRRIDYRSAWVFIATGIPGAVTGAVVTRYVPRSVFDLWLGVMLLTVATLMLVLGTIKPKKHAGDSESRPPLKVVRGGLLSAVVAFVANIVGIGGGILHVPGMVYLLGFPVHLAAGTSHFVLAFTAGAGTIAHVLKGDLAGGYGLAGALAVGVIFGAQIGARLSKRTPPAWILRLLGVALLLVGVRVAVQALYRPSPESAAPASSAQAPYQDVERGEHQGEGEQQRPERP